MRRLPTVPRVVIPKLDPSFVGPSSRIPRHHHTDESSHPDGGAIFGFGGSPVVTSVVLGASGLSILAGMMPATASAATINAEEARAPETAIVFVGMNETASHEVAGLRAKVGYDKVHFIKSAKDQDTITLHGVKYDLTKDEGREGFATALGLHGEKAEALAEILKGTNDDARDEAAQLAVVFYQAENGARVTERLVLSGHSVGSGLWGDGNGYLTLNNIGKLAALFPHAAGQIEDLIIAGCYSGGRSTMDKYRTIFPNLKTIWAYDGSAPGSVSGAVPHLTRWERGTRGHDPSKLTRDVAEHTRKGENVAVWTSTTGYDNGEEAGPIEVDRNAYTSSAENLPAFLSGETAVTDPQTGPLRTHYNNIQRLLSRGDLPAAERSSLEAERDQVIRLLYYGNVRSMFETVYGAETRAVLTTLGLDAANFATLSRAEALGRIAEFDERVGIMESVPSNVDYVRSLLHGVLRDLSPEFVPEAWI